MAFHIAVVSAWLSLISLLTPTDSVEIVFAGDAMQHTRQIEAARQPDGSLNYEGYFTALQPYIESADFAVVNLETPLGGPPYSGYPQFCAHDNYLKAIKDTGFDMVLLANNHILDRRDKGVTRTIATCERESVPFVGVYRNKEHRDSILPLIRDINGFKIAFLNYTYGTNGIIKTSDIEIDYIDRSKMASDIREAREAGAELIAVCVHWGVEYKLLPHPSQKSLANYLDSLGVEMIIGGHPHVIQPMELKKNSGNGHPVFIAYSLGNFISNMNTNDTRGGAMVRLTLARDFLGKAYVKDASYRLVFTEPNLYKGDNFKILPAESDMLSPSLDLKRRCFIDNAERVFNRHNINVCRDTLPLSYYLNEIN